MSSVLNIKEIKERDRNLLESAKQKDYDYIQSVFVKTNKKILSILQKGTYLQPRGVYDIPMEDLLPEDFEENLYYLSDYDAEELLIGLLSVNLALEGITIDIVRYRTPARLRLALDSNHEVLQVARRHQKTLKDYYDCSSFVAEPLQNSILYKDTINLNFATFQGYRESREDAFIKWFKGCVEKEKLKAPETPVGSKRTKDVEPNPKKAIKVYRVALLFIGMLLGLFLANLITY